MNAKEYYQQLIGITIDFDAPHPPTHAPDTMVEFAEAYHRAKVEAVTDEEIYNHVEADCRSEHGHVIMDEQAYFEGAKWLRNKLLNQ